MGVNFDSIGFGSSNSFFANNETSEIEASDVVEGKKSKRRTTACIELSQRYEYRRAFSEVRMLEAMKHVVFKRGFSYNFITAGDVDSLSYLKCILNQHKLDYVLCSTWCMAAEDILQIQQWYDEARIKKIDLYVGEIFPNSYKIEWHMVKEFYKNNPEAGKVVVFKNHSKIYAGCNYDEEFYFGIQTSANINTNPRTEQGSITIDKNMFDFYKDYFDGIKSFEK